MLHRLSELPASQCGSWELCLSTTYLLNPLKHIMPAADLNASMSYPVCRYPRTCKASMSYPVCRYTRTCKAYMSYLVCSYPKDLYSQHVLPCMQVPPGPVKPAFPTLYASTLSTCKACMSYPVCRYPLPCDTPGHMDGHSQFVSLLGSLACSPYSAHPCLPSSSTSLRLKIKYLSHLTSSPC